ncbi:uncharacterized protein TRIADDRAFT_22947, partial [Trichoplax adhaerens]
NRTSLPAPMMSREDITIWSILKHSIGKDLSRITMPVYFNEPLSFLQRLAEYMEYDQLLDIAAESQDPLIRIQYVAAFAVSSSASNWNRIGKPFNPLLGETYELVTHRFQLVTEQVSHHPPISAFHCRSLNNNYSLSLSVQPKLKFWGKGVEVIPKGVAILEFPKLGEIYTWSQVTTYIHNVITGKLWIEQYGNLDVINHTNGYKCSINFKPSGWFGKDLNRLQGFVTDANKEKAYSLEGKWTEELHSNLLNPALIKTRKSSKTSLPTSKDADEDLENDGKSSLNPSQSTANSLAVPYQNTSKTSSNNDLTDKPMYGMTAFSFMLNELTTTLEKYLPRTDSRFRPDIRYLELGSTDKAASEKLRLEEKQRAARRERAKNKTEYQPKWFYQTTNKFIGAQVWEFNGKYWNGDYEDCPHIYEDK